MIRGLESWLARLSDPDGVANHVLPALAREQIDPLINLAIRHNVHLAVLRNLIDLAKSGTLQISGPGEGETAASADLLQSLRDRRFAEVASNTVIANAARIGQGFGLCGGRLQGHRQAKVQRCRSLDRSVMRNRS